MLTLDFVGSRIVNAFASIVSPDLPLFPKTYLHWAQLAMGLICLWVSLRKQPLSGRDGIPYGNQRVMRLSFRVLGIALIGVAIIGMWLAKW